MCYKFFAIKSTLFATKTRFSNKFSQHHWQESFDGDSLPSLSRFDTYGRNPSMVIPLLSNQDLMPMLPLTSKKSLLWDKTKIFVERTGVEYHINIKLQVSENAAPMQRNLVLHWVRF